MSSIKIDDVRNYVENNIGNFHSKRLESIEKLKLSIILKRKNPYLFKAKNILTSQDLVKTLLDAHLSSQEETIFGDFLENYYFNGNRTADAHFIRENQRLFYFDDRPKIIFKKTK